MDNTIDDPLVVAATAGDERAFAELTGRYRRELHVHCYRMLGSFDDAEDRVQDTFLRAWRKRATFEGRSTYRAWLYRIATNSCLEVLRRAPRATVALSAGTRTLPPYSTMPWLQPYPDALLDARASADEAPDVLVVAKETIELAYLAAIQLLPPRQRAALILRDVLAFSAAETASLLDETTAAVNSALQRARATLQKHRDSGAFEAPAPTPTATERELLKRYMDAHEHSRPADVVELLRADVRLTISPHGMCWDGRDEVAPSFVEHMNDLGEFRCVATRANRQPAVANYLRAWGDTIYRAFTLVVLGIQDGELTDMATFARPELFTAFGLAPTL